mgnify:FL=1
MNILQETEAMKHYRSSITFCVHPLGGYQTFVIDGLRRSRAQKIYTFEFKRSAV